MTTRLTAAVRWRAGKIWPAKKPAFFTCPGCRVVMDRKSPGQGVPVVGEHLRGCQTKFGRKRKEGR